MLTAKGEEIDKVVGLKPGADDYITLNSAWGMDYYGTTRTLDQHIPWGRVQV